MTANMPFKSAARSDPAPGLVHLWVSIELEFCPALDPPPLILTDGTAHDGHNPAVFVNIQALKIWAVLDQGSPSTLVPNPRLSSMLPKLPSYRRADCRFGRW
jgi:hypothetical protein